MGLYDYISYASIALFVISIVAFVIIKLAGRNVGVKKLVDFLNGVSDFAKNVDKIDDVNMQQFEATCLSENCPKAFTDGWETFKTARFGYPSEYFEKNDFSTNLDVKKHNKKATITLVILYVLSVGVFGAGVWLLDPSASMTNVVYLIGRILRFASICLIPWLVLFSASRNKTEKVTSALDNMLDSLDAKVQIQKHESYAIDVSKLDSVINLISQIIDEEENKPIPTKKEQLEKAAALEAESQEDAEEIADESDESVEELDNESGEELDSDEILPPNELEDESLDDIRSEILFDEDSDVQEISEDNIADEDNQEKPDVVEKYMDSSFEPVSYGYLPSEDELISVEYKSPAEVEEPTPVPKKKPIDFNKFNMVLNQIIDGGYSRALYLKVAKLMLVAFEKFKEPEQRADLKQSIRRLIQAYRLAA